MAKRVMPAARRAEDFMWLSLSPQAPMNTQKKVAGARPAYSARTMKEKTLPRMQPQPRQSGWEASAWWASMMSAPAFAPARAASAISTPRAHLGEGADLIARSDNSGAAADEDHQSASVVITPSFTDHDAPSPLFGFSQPEPCPEW